MRLSPFAAFLFFGRHFAAAKETENDPDYLLIGAGGGSLQMALFLQRHNYTYKILEQKDVVGSHWTSFPVFDELISVNKYTRNENQRLRYDWHSFLEAPRQMYDVTDEYFPKGQDFHRYMSLVAKEAGILPNVEFNVQVDRVLDDGTPCVLLSTGEKRCAKKRVFVGTGLTEKKEPYLQAMGGIPYSKITKDMARRRRVCILGNGNSGFEVAQNLFGVAEKVVLFGRSPPRWSSVTRYTGDVRTKYLQVLENYNAKLLDDVGFFSSDTHYGSLDGLDGLSGSQKKVVETMVQVVTWLHEFQCETFVITTGFQSSTPTGLDMILSEDEEGANEYNRRRFPPTDDWYQSTNNPSVHFLGWLMHERDFRRGAGGFLSGYRYLVRNLFYQIHAENQGKPYPNEILTKEQAIARAVERVQTADDLIILQDGVVLRDMIVPANAQYGDGEDSEKLYHYYAGVTYQFLEESHRDDAVFMYFGWGGERSVETVFDSHLRYGDTGRLMNRFLHPIFEANGIVREIHEDLDMSWTEPSYAVIVERVARYALDGNLSRFKPRVTHSFQRSQVNQTVEPDFESADLSQRVHGEFKEEVIPVIAASVYTNASEVGLQALKESVKAWMPALFDHEIISDVAAVDDVEPYHREL